MGEVMKKQFLQEKIKILPDLPGCYLYKNIHGDIIYVGKAKDLKKRVGSYFVGHQNKKTELLVKNIVDLEYIIVNTEKEALILENNLIKKYRPQYNIKLKDDKSYPYIMITKEKHPRVLLTRSYKKNSKNIFFGPYVDIKSANQLKNIIDKIYPLRKCHPVDKRPCMYYQIGECIGPCAKNITNDEYTEQINNIKTLLSGNTIDTIKYLEKKIEHYSKNLEFENAKKFYEYVTAINLSIENQLISTNNNIDRDYIGYASNDEYICIQIFLSRNGGIIERKIEYFELYTNEQEIIYSYLMQYYSINKLPKEIYLLNINTELVSDILGVSCIEPKIGNHKKILSTVINNAQYYLENDLKIEKVKMEKNINTLNSLAVKLGINSLNSIDAFDNSNIMGRDAVSVKVNFLNGQKNTYGYRKYKVKYTEGINDIETMKEVLYRNYKDKNATSDLIIVDGGENHVRAAIDVVHNSLKLNIKIIGLAKNEKHITEYIVTDDFEIINIDKKSEEYLFLKRIQDEVHRFAIDYHRSLKTKNMFNSKLDNVKGIGKNRRKILLEHYDSIEDIKNAKSEELKSLGIPEKVIIELKENI